MKTIEEVIISARGSLGAEKADQAAFGYHELKRAGLIDATQTLVLMSRKDAEKPPEEKAVNLTELDKEELKMLKIGAIVEFIDVLDVLGATYGTRELKGFFDMYKAKVLNG